MMALVLALGSLAGCYAGPPRPYYYRHRPYRATYVSPGPVYAAPPARGVYVAPAPVYAPRVVPPPAPVY